MDVDRRLNSDDADGPARYSSLFSGSSASGAELVSRLREIVEAIAGRFGVSLSKAQRPGAGLDPAAVWQRGPGRGIGGVVDRDGLTGFPSEQRAPWGPEALLGDLQKLFSQMVEETRDMLEAVRDYERSMDDADLLGTIAAAARLIAGMAMAGPGWPDRVRLARELARFAGIGAEIEQRLARPRPPDGDLPLVTDASSPQASPSDPASAEAGAR